MSIGVILKNLAKEGITPDSVKMSKGLKAAVDDVRAQAPEIEAKWTPVLQTKAKDKWANEMINAGVDPAKAYAAATGIIKYHMLKNKMPGEKLGIEYLKDAGINKEWDKIADVMSKHDKQSWYDYVVPNDSTVGLADVNELLNKHPGIDVDDKEVEYLIGKALNGELHLLSSYASPEDIVNYATAMKKLGVNAIPLTKPNPLNFNAPPPSSNTDLITNATITTKSTFSEQESYLKSIALALNKTSKVDNSVTLANKDLDDKIFQKNMQKILGMTELEAEYYFVNIGKESIASLYEQGAMVGATKDDFIAALIEELKVAAPVPAPVKVAVPVPAPVTGKTMLDNWRTPTQDDYDRVKFNSPEDKELFDAMHYIRGTNHPLSQSIERLRYTAEKLGLDDIDNAAINFYTRTGDRYLNQTLRGFRKPEKEIEHMFDLTVQRLNKALDKLPAHNYTTLYRRAGRYDKLGKEIHEQYKEGEIITEKAFMSTTSRPVPTSLAEVRFIIQPTGTGVGTNAKPSKGKYIEDLTEFRGEHEVLYPAASKFYVLKKELTPNGWDIHLLEVQD